jgi:AbiU2
MNVNDRKITSLREKVKAAQQEFDWAVVFHEVWKPAAYNDDLHRRMGVSYATNAFHVVRVALRREMLLALMRLWDKSAPNIRMDLDIANPLRNKDIINALAADRASSLATEGSFRQELSQRAGEAIALISKYSKGGSHYDVRKKLWDLRCEHLAHRQTVASAATGADVADGEIESFYQDNSKLIRLLLSVVEAVAYDPEDAAGVYRFYAKHFWAGVCGEQTEGHPNYRTHLPITPTN